MIPSHDSHDSESECGVEDEPSSGFPQLEFGLQLAHFLVFVDRSDFRFACRRKANPRVLNRDLDREEKNRFAREWVSEAKRN